MALLCPPVVGIALLAVGCSVTHVGVDAGRGEPDVAVAPALSFEDVTLRAGIAIDRVPVEGWQSFADRISGGVCVIEVGEHDAPDLFFAIRPSESGTSRLYVAHTPLAYVDETDARGLADVGDAIGCLVFDADGDAMDDLLVTGVGGVRLFLQRRDQFVDASDRLADVFESDVVYASAAAGDIDADGDVDLLISGYMRRDPAVAAMTDCAPLPCAAELSIHSGAPNLLLTQTADGSFADASARAPDLDLNEATLVVVIGDMIAAGSPQLFIGNDLGSFHQNRLLAMDGSGDFIDIAWDAGMHANWRGYGIDTMGFSSADIDRDGRLEHAVTSFEGRMTTIYDCEPDVLCEDFARSYGMEASDDTFRWGAAFVDLNLDGWPDLVEATGHYHDDAEIAHYRYLGARDQPPNVYRNDGAGHLVRETRIPGDGSNAPRSARGIAVTDLDNDGRPDLVLAPAIGSAALLLNTRPRAGGWLTVRLVDRAPNPGAIGARVLVDGVVQERRAGEGYLGSFDPRLFFGTGDARIVDVEVRWPDGEVTRRSGIEVDQEIEIAR